jgi:hypothetical protein
MKEAHNQKGNKGLMIPIPAQQFGRPPGRLSPWFRQRRFTRLPYADGRLDSQHIGQSQPRVVSSQKLHVGSISGIG